MPPPICLGSGWNWSPARRRAGPQVPEAGVGGCRKAGGGKSETGAALSGRAQVWPDKVYQMVPAANRWCGAGPRALAGGCAQADSAFPVLSGGLVSQRAGEREKQREREGGREGAFQPLHPDDKRSQRPLGPLTSQLYERWEGAPWRCGPGAPASPGARPSRPQDRLAAPLPFCQP